jgi:hypothetical protein
VCVNYILCVVYNNKPQFYNLQMKTLPVIGYEDDGDDNGTITAASGGIGSFTSLPIPLYIGIGLGALLLLLIAAALVKKFGGKN